MGKYELSDEQLGAFGDISDLDGLMNGSTGIFGAEEAALRPALKEHDTVTSEAMADGAHLTAQCRVCGKTRIIIAGYPELIAIGERVAPQMAFPNGATPWYYSQKQGWWPDQRCPCPHQALLAPYLSSSEAQGYVRKAMENGWIDPQQVQQLMQRAQQVRAAAQSRG